MVKAYLPEKAELEEIVKALWAKPQREYQYFAQELVFKYAKQLKEGDIELLEYMVIHKSWWETVDFIAVKLMGKYFQLFPDQKAAFVEKWINAGNIWLQRSALLFQLKYKKAVDVELLSSTIQALSGTKEFFLNKAIGWVLREYSRTNQEWVRAFVSSTSLSSLSKREALRLIE